MGCICFTWWYYYVASCNRLLDTEKSKKSLHLYPVKTPDLKKRLAYLQACYVADNRELSLTDFLNKRKVEHPYLVEGKEELINDFSPKIALPEEYAEEVSKMARLYQNP